MKSREGLTLIELLVSLSIAGIVLSAGYGMVSTLADARTHSDRLTRERAAAFGARTLLTELLSGVHLSIEQPVSFLGVSNRRDGEPDATLTFITTSVTPINRSMARVRLYVDRDDSTATRGLVAAIREDGALAERVVPLMPAATGLSLRFLDRNVFAESWSESWVSTNVLPSTIELRLSTSSDTTLSNVLLLPVIVSLRGTR